MAIAKKDHAAKVAAIRGAAREFELSDLPLLFEEHCVREQEFTLKLRADTIAKARDISKVSGESVETTIVRAIGEGIAGELRACGEALVFSRGLPCLANKLNGLRMTIVLPAHIMAVAARCGRHMPDEKGTPMPVSTMLSDFVWQGLVDAERRWLGTRWWGDLGSGRITADVTTPRGRGRVAA